MSNNNIDFMNNISDSNININGDGLNSNISN